MCMCDFSQKRIRSMGCCIRLLALLLLVGAGGLGFIIYMIHRDEEFLQLIPVITVLNLKDYNMLDAVSVVSYVLIGIIILMAIWACCVTRIITKYCLCPFALFVTIVTILTLAVGIVLVFNGVIVREEFLKDACEKVNSNIFDQFEWELERQVFQKVREIDTFMNPFNSQMCSPYCPCAKSSQAWSKYNAIPEKELNQFNRSKLDSTDNKSPNNTTPLIWLADLERGFYSLEKCQNFW